tara:strand:+ start:324 stop:533 length:210 start_codon:yes stop_codon:yes gene_type:complete
MIKFKDFDHGKKLAKIKGRHYMFVSVGHPWNECAAYLADKSGNILDEEPAIFGVCASPESLAAELMKCQ